MNPSPHVCSALLRQTLLSGLIFLQGNQDIERLSVATAQLQRDGGAAVCDAQACAVQPPPSASEGSSPRGASDQTPPSLTVGKSLRTVTQSQLLAHSLLAFNCWENNHGVRR